MVEPLDWDQVVIEAKRRRAEEKLSQQAHAALAGVSRDTIRAFDHFERSITLEKALAILRAVGLAQEKASDESGHAAFIRRATERWQALIQSLPSDHPARFPNGL